MTQPELTVAMPARNSGRFITAAIQSVLAQRDVDFELIVLDDASSDDTAQLVKAVEDTRIRLVRNELHRGIGACHNRIVAEARAPFLTQMDSDGVLLGADALQAALSLIRADETLAQVCCHVMLIESDGRADVDLARKMRTLQVQSRKPGENHQISLMRDGNAAYGLRTYRVSALKRMGPFNERISYGTEYEMALRLAEAYRMDVLPRVCLAARRREGNTTMKRAIQWRLALQRYSMVRRLEREGHISYSRSLRAPLFRGVARDLYGLSGLDRMAIGATNALAWSRERSRVRVRLAAHRTYRVIASGRVAWPLRWLPGKKDVRPDMTRIGYYLWRFPSPSQTFVRRELETLLAADHEIVLFAEELAPDWRSDPGLQTWAAMTTPLSEMAKSELHSHHRHFRANHLLRYANVLLFVLFHSYSFYKSLTEDRFVFDRIVRLAGSLGARGITHLHCPWADLTSFVAAAAARLAGITYSVQGRAHDLHRRQQAFALREKFAAAAFIVTNSRFNLRHIGTFLREGDRDKVHMIYEGIRPGIFQVRRHDDRTSGPLQILCVARLIEEKGLTFLLDACQILRERGTDFRCEIVGGSERPTYTDYEIELRRQILRLDLGTHVTLSGPKPFAAVMNAFQRADLFVLPCVVASNGGRDITPNALIEAMASGLPCISTSIAAIPEIIDHEVDGLLVPPSDAVALAAAIRRLAEDNGLCRSLGSRARIKVEMRFNLEVNGAKIADLFRSGGADATTVGGRRT